MNGDGNARFAVNRRQLLTGLGAGALLLLGGCPRGALSGVDSPPGSAAAELGDLEVFTAGFPRATSFRLTESVKDATFEAWHRRFRWLNGIEGKALAEEIPIDEETVQDYFTRFKAAHPDKLVLLHLNGKARHHDFHIDRYFAGHWLYYAGTTTTAKAPKQPTETRVKVTDSGVFKPNRLGLPENDPDVPHEDLADDIVLAAPGPDGRPDFHRAEQLKLVRVEDAHTIVVKRAQYGSAPIEAPSGSHIAPHVRVRPKGLKAGALWAYNFSTECPRDSRGRTAGQRLAQELAEEYFAEGKPLRNFDGVQFDVMFFIADGVAADAEDPPGDGDLIDVDNDRRPDRGLLGPRQENAYGKGVVALGAELRKALPGKLILADGMLPEAHQRNFDSFNGMESEGFPTLRDPLFGDWGGGLNQHRFWASRAVAPRYNYTVHKYVGAEHGRYLPTKNRDAYALARLAMAATVFTGSTFAVGGLAGPHPVPDRGSDQQLRVIDELWRGVDRRPNWLGTPLAAAVHLATKEPDLFGGAATRWDSEFVSEIDGPGASVTRVRDGVAVRWDPATPARERAPDTRLPLRTVTVPLVEPHPGDDLFVRLSLRCAPVSGYPDQIRRRVRVRAFAGGEEIEIRPPHGPRNAAEHTFTWADGEPFDATFLFRNGRAGDARLEITAEGDGEVVLRRITAHASTDAVVREFEHGVVIANPSTRRYTFRLAELTEKPRLWRIKGHRQQRSEDRVRDGRHVNDGAEIPGLKVTLPPRDALFLRDTPPGR